MIVRDVYLHTTDSRQPNAVCYLECVRRARSVLIHGVLLQPSDFEFTTWCSLPRRWLYHCLIFEDMLIGNIDATILRNIDNINDSFHILHCTILNTQNNILHLRNLLVIITRLYFTQHIIFYINVIIRNRSFSVL